MEMTFGPATIFTLSVAAISMGCAHLESVPRETPDRAPESVVLGPTSQIENLKIGSIFEDQAMGTWFEAPDQSLRGCVIFLQGFRDSMQSHVPLFSALNRAGYRVLSFDYLGQGQSRGDLDEMRLDALMAPFPKNRDYDLSYQTQFVWRRATLQPSRSSKQSCEGSLKFVIGSSIGGLVAYRLADENWADAYVLISPTLSLRGCATQEQTECLGKGQAPSEASHLMINLRATAKAASWWRIPSTARGLVLWSGDQDAYVDVDAATQLIRSNARSFRIVSLSKETESLIDQGVPAETSPELQNQVVEFLNEIPRRK